MPKSPGPSRKPDTPLGEVKKEVQAAAAAPKPAPKRPTLIMQAISSLGTFETMTTTQKASHLTHEVQVLVRVLGKPPQKDAEMMQKVGPKEKSLFQFEILAGQGSKPFVFTVCLSDHSRPLFKSLDNLYGYCGPNSGPKMVSMESLNEDPSREAQLMTISVGAVEDKSMTPEQAQRMFEGFSPDMYRFTQKASLKIIYAKGE